MFRNTVIMSRHVPNMGEMENAYRISVRKPRCKVCLKHEGIEGRITSKFTLNILGRRAGSAFIWCRMWTSDGLW
jgi:hypothetical protein